MESSVSMKSKKRIKVHSSVHCTDKEGDTPEERCPFYTADKSEKNSLWDANLCGVLDLLYHHNTQLCDGSREFFRQYFMEKQNNMNNNQQNRPPRKGLFEFDDILREKFYTH
ncbi:hypothetical protein ADEAN_000310200 [Angomonas deanei]|uniref:Uncharacterized protein n=1 Tax=Angomonas deanei TaxID=59799 RepID=A0A7G2C9V1_9TRYP|nr:hypothetical protein ADEAN_000310200 [Angomonas deanei]